MYESYRNLISTFSTISNEEWSKIESKLTLVSYKKGDVLLQAGDICKTLRFINKGIARLFFINEEGKEFTCFIAHNDKNSRATDKFILDFESFSKQTPSHSFVDMIEDCEIVELSYDDLQTVFLEVNSVPGFMNKIVGWGIKKK